MKEKSKGASSGTEDIFIRAWRGHARKDARCIGASGLDDAAVADGFLDAEGGKHAGYYDEDERVRHPASGAHTAPETERVVDGRRQARVDTRRGEALRLECERVGEKSVVVQNGPVALASSSS